MARLKLLFFGTPDIAVPFLESCRREHEVLAVIT
ncbi:MAG: methionyl-tRNA formyltransferase, partial [Elusimicrobia bacterium]|nr:methionyl-tRNA formyltransferase [Elusimicrobiota bacterium]